MKMLVLVLACMIALAGCASGSANQCNLTIALSVGAAAEPPGEPNHADPPPGNQEQFFATESFVGPPGCPIPQVVWHAQAVWTVSDPVDVLISSADNDTNGLATCLGPTNGPATVTATVTEGETIKTAIGSITCK